MKLIEEANKTVAKALEWKMAWKMALKMVQQVVQSIFIKMECQHT